MKSIILASILTLFLLSFVTPRLTIAQVSGTSASGSYKFSLEDDQTKYVEFKAQTDKYGTTTGQMTFSDSAEISSQDVEGSGDPVNKDSSTGFYVKAEFDCLTVNKNRAVMSGTVKDSSLKNYIGQRVLLVVEDNGDGINEQDKLTWGFYKPAAEGWVPQDAEREYDEGAGMTWIATDAERKDDVGIPSKQSGVIGCQSFPLSSYSFVDMKYGEGDIQVVP